MRLYVMFCRVWCHFYNLKNVKNTHEGVLLLERACNFTKSDTPLWVFFTFFRLYKWYQIGQNITDVLFTVFLWGLTGAGRDQDFKIGHTAQEMKFLIKDFFNGKLHFLCSDSSNVWGSEWNILTIVQNSLTTFLKLFPRPEIAFRVKNTHAICEWYTFPKDTLGIWWDIHKKFLKTFYQKVINFKHKWTF